MARVVHIFILFLVAFSLSLSLKAWADNATALEDARIALDLERPDRALALLKQIEPVDQREAARVGQMIGEIYLSVGKPAKALDFFETAVMTILEDGEAMAGLAEASFKVGKLKQARRYAESALREDHDLVRAHLVLAKLAAASGSVSKAKLQFETLYQQKNGNEDIAIAYGDFLSGLGDDKAAFAVLEGFIARYTNSAKAHDFLGRLYWATGYQRKAVKMREHAGKLYEKQGNSYRAETILNWVLDHKKSAKRKAKPFSGENDKNSFALARHMEPISIPYGMRIKGTGSGFITMEGRYVVTNHHVINAAQDLIVRNGLGEVRKAKVLKISHMDRDDLAILELDQPYDSSYAVSLDMMGDPMPGRSSIVLGYPLSWTLGNKMPSLSQGAVSKTTGFGDNPNRFHSTAKMNPGNSGGPIFDQYGNVIGVAVSKLSKMRKFKETGILPEDVNEGVKISRLFQLMGWQGGGILEGDEMDRLGLEELYQEMLPKTVYIVNLVRQ